MSTCTGKVVREHPEWLVRGVKGEIYPSLNPAIPEVRNYFIGKISEALAYDIDGIHLDYIRFPDHFSFDAATCAAFQKEYGYSPLERARGNGDWWSPEWIHWNARQVTDAGPGRARTFEKIGTEPGLVGRRFPRFGYLGREDRPGMGRNGRRRNWSTCSVP